MKQIVIRNLEDSVVHRLKKIAWMDGKSPEETARQLLIEAVRRRATGFQTQSGVPEPAA